MSGHLFAISARKSKGKDPKFQDIESLGCVMSTVKLPDAEINGSKQKRTDWHAQLKLEFDRLLPFLANEHISLKDEKAQELWKSRSGRSISEQVQKGLSICRKLKGFLLVVDSHQLTENINDLEKLCCAVGLFDDTIKVSHFYEAHRNYNYSLGKPFSYLDPSNGSTPRQTNLNPRRTCIKIPL